MMGTLPGQEKSLRKTNGSFHTTLKDVAKLAGVSTKTVSRVVNNQGEIRPETRQRVQAAIQELEYRPNVLARSLIGIPMRGRAESLNAAVAGSVILFEALRQRIRGHS